MIPLAIPDITQQERDAVDKVLSSGWLTHGEENRQFEAKFARLIGVRHAISMNSATSALQLAIQAQDITGEVIVPSFTFVASANAIVNAGATPVFADIDIRTGNLDPVDVRRRITPATEAVMPVHFAGLACQMDELIDICDEHRLHLIEDSAEAIGAKHKGRIAGSFGTSCFSFYPTKNITTGEGGMLTTNDDALAARVRAYVGHGIAVREHDRERLDRPWMRDATYAGYNFRMSNILAALGNVQIDRLEAFNRARRGIAKIYNGYFDDHPFIIPPIEPNDSHHVYQMYVVKVRGNRDAFVRALRSAGVGASVHFDPPVHRQTFYRKNFASEPLPHTDEMSRSVISLPIHQGMTDEEAHSVARTVVACAAALPSAVDAS